MTREQKIDCPLCVQFDCIDRLGNRTDLAHGAILLHDPSVQRLRIECERCGNYFCGRDLFEDIRDNPKRPPFSERTALALSWAARAATDQARNNAELLQVTYANYEEIAAGAPQPSGAAFFDSLVQQVAAASKYPGQNTGPLHAAQLAARVFLPVAALFGVADQLQNDGLVTIQDLTPTQFKLTLTPNGWRRVDTIVSTRRSDRVFVAMWFDEGMRAAYEEGVVPALVACGYKRPFRVDDPEHDLYRLSSDYTDRIDNRIIAELRKSRFVVADATGGRRSVCYEAGWADGHDIPVIWTCRHDAIDDLSFDTRQVAHILWSDPAHLQRELVAKIQRHGWHRAG